MKAHEFIYEMTRTSSVFGRKNDVYVTFEGEGAFTDGKRINIPALGLDKKLTQAQIRAMRGYVDHEAGHIRHSDMPRIMEVYDRWCNNGKEDLKNIQNCLEDVWMESKVVEEYPGAQKNLKQCQELVKQKEVESFEGHEENLKGLTPTSVCLAITSSKEMFSGDPDSYQTKMNELLDPKMQEYGELWVKQALEATCSEDLITLAKSIWKLLEQDPEMEQDPQDFDPQSGEGDPEGENSEQYQRGNKEAGMEGTMGRPSEGKGEGQGKDDGEGRKVKGNIGEALTDSTGDGASGCIGSNDGPLKGGYKVYSTKDDKVFKRGGKNHDPVVESNDHHKYDVLKSQLKSNIMTMKTKLKRSLLAKQQRDWDFGREDGRLDTKRLVGAYSGSQTVFKQRIDREDFDTAITVLVDLSGSMYGSKSTTARDCAIALAECFEGSQLSYKIVGFRNRRDASEYGRGNRGQFHRYEALDTVVFKDYDMNLRQCRASVALLDDAVGGNNTDYDFIQNEVSELKRRTEKRKVLFVLSDGHPAHRSDSSSSELTRHCNDAVKAAQKDGVECIGIGIEDNAVKEIYPDHVVVNNVSDLSGVVFGKLTKLLVGK